MSAQGKTARDDVGQVSGGFTVEISALIYLTIEQVWPDGDAPENPTAGDVVAVMESCGRKRRVLDDWDLLDELEVAVDGCEVWSR